MLVHYEYYNALFFLAAHYPPNLKKGSIFT